MLKTSEAFPSVTASPRGGMENFARAYLQQKGQLQKNVLWYVQVWSRFKHLHMIICLNVFNYFFHMLTHLQTCSNMFNSLMFWNTMAGKKGKIKMFQNILKRKFISEQTILDNKIYIFREWTSWRFANNSVSVLQN